MTSHLDIDNLKANLKRWTLIFGVLQITVGCMIGFIPPSAVAWYRGIVMAHIELTANGVLMVAFGFLVKELRLSPLLLKLWFALAANRHVDKRIRRSGSSLYRRFVEAHVDNERKIPAAKRHGQSNRHWLTQVVRSDHHGGVTAHPLRPLAIQELQRFVILSEAKDLLLPRAEKEGSPTLSSGRGATAEDSDKEIYPKTTTAAFCFPPSLLSESGHQHLHLSTK